MSNYSTNLKIELINTGTQAGQWGDTTNVNLGIAIEQAIVGRADVVMSGNTETLTLTNQNTAQNARAIYLNLSGLLTAAGTLNVPAIQKPYIVRNGTTGGFAVTVKVSGQIGVSVPNGATMWLYNNGSDVVNAITNLPAGTTIDGIPISTGAGSGTVTSVNVAPGTTGLTFTGGPITTSGDITAGGVLAGAHGGTGQNNYVPGDMLFASTSNTLSRRSIGSNGQILSVGSSGFPVWITPQTGGSVTRVQGSGTVNGISLTGDVTTSGFLNLSGAISGLAASAVSSGIFDTARIPNLPASIITSGTFGTGVIPNLDASKITSGVLPTARGGTGAGSLTDAGIVVTSGNQNISGTKTFSSIVSTNYNFTIDTSIGLNSSTATSEINARILDSNGIPLTTCRFTRIANSPALLLGPTGQGGISRTGEVVGFGWSGVNGINVTNASGGLVEFTSGNVTKPGGGTFNAPSDARLKTNITSYKIGLSAINSLSPVSYDLFDCKKKIEENVEEIANTNLVGLIAQDVQETELKDMVFEGPDGYLNLNSSNITYALVNAVKELSAEITALKAELAELRK